METLARRAYGIRRKAVWNQDRGRSDTACCRCHTRQGRDAIRRATRADSMPSPSVLDKTKRRTEVRLFVFGAGGGGRTRTVSLPPDFESGTSANSITPAWGFDLHSISHTKEKIKIREKKSFCRLLPCKAHLYCPLLLTFSRVYYIIME